MTKVTGDWRFSSALGNPHEYWFRQLETTDDWSTLDRPLTGDPKVLRDVFMTVRGLSEKSGIISYPREFNLDPADPKVRAARHALATIGAHEFVALIDRDVSREELRRAFNASAPERGGTSSANLEAWMADEIAQMEARRALQAAETSGQKVRKHLIAWLETSGVFPMPLPPGDPEPLSTRLDPETLARFEAELLKLMTGKPE